MIKAINGAGKPNAMKEGVRQLVEELPLMLEHGRLIAKLHRSKYLALKAEGFSDPEALELCKNVF